MIRLISLGLAAAMLLGSMPAPAQSQLRKVSPDNLSHYWIRTNTYVDAQAPNGGQGLNAVGCAAVSYRIGSDGVTRHVKVEKVVPATSDFQLTATSLVKGLRYQAASANEHDVPVQTYFIVPFNVPDNSPDVMAKVLQSCHLNGYGD